MKTMQTLGLVAVMAAALSGASTNVAAGAAMASSDTTRISADEAFMRSIAFYTRDMLDRGGWVNPYVADDTYAAGNPLLAAHTGDGVTSAGQT